MPTYDPTKVSIAVGSTIMVGKGESTFVASARNGDGYTLKVGADGKYTRSKNADKSGTITVTLLADSEVNDALDKIAVSDEDFGTGIVPISVNDNNGTARAKLPFGWVKKIPDLERQKEMGEVTWTFEGGSLELHQGSGLIDVEIGT